MRIFGDLVLSASHRVGLLVRAKCRALAPLPETPWSVWPRQKSGFSYAGLVLAVFLAAISIPSAMAQAPRGDTPASGGVSFLIRFTGSVHGLEPGAPVEVRGIRIGEVVSVGVEYDPGGNRFVAPVTITLQPTLFPASGPRPHDADETYAAAAALVQRGLRAQLGTTQLIGGQTIVTLDIQPDAPPATLGRTGLVPELPAGPTRAEMLDARLAPLLDKLADVPVDRIFADLQATMASFRDLANGPELRATLNELRGAAANLRGVLDRFGPRTDRLIANLDATLQSTNRLVGTLDQQIGERSPLLGDLRGLVQQLDGAARSMRLLAEYLERNPSALIAGKSDNRR